MTLWYLEINEKRYIMVYNDLCEYVFRNDGVYCRDTNGNCILYKDLYHIVNLNIDLHQPTQSGWCNDVQNMICEYLNLNIPYENNVNIVVEDVNGNQLKISIKFDETQKLMIVDKVRKPIHIIKEDYYALIRYLLLDKVCSVFRLNCALKYIASGKSIYDTSVIDGDILMVGFCNYPFLYFPPLELDKINASENKYSGSFWAMRFYVLFFQKYFRKDTRDLGVLIYTMELAQ